MMMPIYVDFAVSFCGAIAGAITFFTRLKVVDRNIYTPIMEAIIVSFGSLGWSVFALMSFTAITSIPKWLSDGEVWSGSWGYTLSRVLMLIAWILTLILISRTAAYMQVRKQFKFEGEV